MSMDSITYFGYGSLVNRATRPSGEIAQPARLYGWERVWGHRVLSAQQPADEPPRSCCSLSVRKLCDATLDRGKNATFIDGVVVTIPISEVPALDRREAGYDRLSLPGSDFDLPADCASGEIQVYVSKPTHQGKATEEFPILQSYIDCVLAGYCEMFEVSGMQHFVQSTAGWDGVIENERSHPKYPRAVNVPEEQLAAFDQIIFQQRLRLQQESP